MLLTKLELAGFKSFANRTEICFDRGVTGIIGPNGSGKSNISEAIRWVLGEQSARSLRGTRMEDIIFSGTQAKKPLAYAEVTLTLSNEDRLLDVAYNEIAITRRVYRSGESEYFINRTPCRLKDIVELFRDTGIGKEGYSVIGQGRIDEILSNRSEDRRAVFEEAAGISKYRARKEEAERKLAATRDNLVRIGDIVGELQDRLGPLEEQAEVARQYLKLKEELKAIELTAFLHQYDRAHSKIAAQAELIASFSARSAELDLRAGELRRQAEVLTDDANRSDAEISAAQQNMIDLARKVEQQDAETRLCSERMEHLEKEIEACRKSAGEAGETLRALAAEKEETQAAFIKESALQKDAAERSGALAGRAAAANEELAAREERLEAEKQKMLDAMNRLSGAKIRASRLEAMLESLEERRAKNALECAVAGEEFLALEQEEAEAKAAQQAREDARRALIQKRDAAQQRQEECARATAALAEEHRRQEREKAALESRRRVLFEMKENFEGYYAGVKRLLQDCEKGLAGRGIVGVVANLLRVPAELETAMELTLGTALQNIVAADEGAAKAAIEYLRQKNYGRATFLPLTAIRPRLLTAAERKFLSMPGCLGAACDLVQTEPAYRAVLEHLLGRTVVVERMEDGIRMARASGAAFRIVTLKGDIMNPGGSMTGGSAQNRTGGLLGRERELSELGERLDQCSAALQATVLKQQAAQQQAEEAACALQAEAEALQELGIALAQCAEKAETLTALAAQQRSQLAAKQEEGRQLEAAQADVTEQLTELKRSQSALENSSSLTEAEAAKAGDAIAALRAQCAALSEELSAAKLEALALEKSCEAYQDRLQRLAASEAQARLSEQKAKAAGEEAGRALAALREQSAGALADAERLRAQASACAEEIRMAEERREALKAQAQELTANAAKTAEEAFGLNEQAHQAELVKNRTEVELTALQERIWQEYELTYEGALSYKQELSFTRSQRQTDQIRREIRALGEVNVNAIEDCRALKERYEDLVEQQQDLTKAEADLSQLIEELMTSMRRQFRTQFSAINKLFGETFVELFGGGSAELRLEGEDVLSCDIDIIAQPPGKKLQFLSLLSGGERALTAIALLFAILKHKPMPFCVLDEIEASLDEANVDNYARYLKRYAQTTQFIIITHRKGSMEVCDSLYGVAMEEKGVSRLISVRLDDAQASAG